MKKREVWVEFAGSVKRGVAEGERHGGGLYVSIDGGTVGVPQYSVFDLESEALASLARDRRRQAQSILAEVERIEDRRKAAYRRENGLS